MQPEEFRPRVQKAVRHYWTTKSTALRKNKSGKKADQGKRGGATSGKNLDGFAALFEKLVQTQIGRNIDVHKDKGGLVLPGHFRPSKQWDVVVTQHGKMLAVVEFKSLGGPSFGNNANNRCEEALGSGVDFAVAQREGRFGAGANPFVGYVILVEDEESSRRDAPKGNLSKHFDLDPIFKNASYQTRMKILCERLMQERIYSASAVITSASKDAKTGAYRNLSPETSIERLICKFIAHIEIETSNEPDIPRLF